MKKTGTKEKLRFVYEPPVAVELSGHRVNGQQVKPPGWCWTGSNPGECNAGSSYVPPPCHIGTWPDFPDKCETGGSPWNRCRTGSAV